MDTSQTPAWLPLAEAAQRLGTTVDALRKRVRRELVMARRGQDGRIEVLVTPEIVASHSPDTGEGEARHRPDEGEALRLLVQLDEAHERVEAWRSAAETAKLEAAGLRAERDAAVATAAAKVEAAERVIAELRAMLADARRPWWRRWLGLVPLLVAVSAPQLAGAAESRLCPVRGAGVEAAFEKCRAGDTVSVAVPAAKDASILAARVCDFGKGMLVQRQGDKPEDGIVLACVYTGKVRPLAE
jgi:hypothetical protein